MMKVLTNDKETVNKLIIERRDHSLSHSQLFSINTYSIFLLRLFDSKGFYDCIGSNTAGEDVKTAQLIYAGIVLYL